MPPQTNGKPPAFKTVGYIGLGNAGYSMASNLPKAGFHLVVHDVDNAKAQKAASEWQNTTASEGRPEAFADCEVIVTMLPNGKVVKDALLGGNGIARALKPGTIIIDTSSSSPFDTIALGKELAQHSLELIEAPITQTYMHATDHGESTLMVGSDKEEVYEKASPVLHTMGSYVFLMGPLGHGHAMKTINNYVMASSLVALCDSVIAGQKYGLDPQQMIDVLNVGTGVNFQTLDPFRRDALTKRYNSGFGLGLLVKDLGITEEFMKHNEVETELPGLLRGYLRDALERVEEPMADHTKALEGWEKKWGVKVNKTEKVQDIPREDFEHRLKGLNRKE